MISAMDCITRSCVKQKTTKDNEIIVTCSRDETITVAKI